MTEYLALVRHGETLPNTLVEQQAQGLFYEVSGSDETVGLTDFGIKQLAAVGKRLAKLFTSDNPITRIFTSGFKRTKQSANHIEEELPYKPEQVEDRRFDKRSYGDLWNVTYRGVQELYPEEYERFLKDGPLIYSPPNGENYPQLFSRVAAGLADLSKLSGNQVIVCHLVVFLAIQRELDGHTDEQVYTDYEACSVPNGHIRLYKRESPELPWVPAEVSI